MNDSCPVCLESLVDKSITLSCHHVMHIECTRQLIRPNCPLCNQLVLNFPRAILDGISENGKRYRDEVEREHMEELLRSFHNETYSTDAYTSSPQLQAFYAIAWLREHGIPYSRIPSSLSVNLEDIQSSSQPYAIFEAIVMMVLNALTSEIGEIDDYLYESGSEADAITDEDDELFRTQGSDIERSIEVREPGNRVMVRYKLDDIPPLPDEAIREIDE